MSWPSLTYSRAAISLETYDTTQSQVMRGLAVGGAVVSMRFPGAIR